MKTPKILLCFCLSLCLSIVLFGCTAEVKKEAPRAVPVTLRRIDPKAVSDSITLLGAMDSRNSVDLFPRIDGYVEKIEISPGMVVKQGQLLLEIDSVKQDAAVAAKRSSVDLAMADYAKEKGKLGSLVADKDSRQSMVDFNGLEYQRYYWLEKRGVVPLATVDQEERDLRVSKARLASLDAEIVAQKDVIERAKKRIDEAKAELRAEQAELAYHTMKAPFSGVMGDVPVKVGDYVNPQTKLTKISKTKPLEVTVEVPQDQAKSIRVGTALEILDNDGTPLGRSSVFYVAPTVNLQTQSVMVKAEYPNLKDELRPDESVQVKLILNTAAALSVPTEAISFVAGKAFIFVSHKGADGQLVARQQPIEISDIQNNQATVKSGLNAGDEIVVSGIQLLSDNTPIVPAAGGQ